MMDYSKYARVLRKIREARSELRKQYEEQDAELQRQQEIVENALLAAMQEAHVESVRTDSGTIYISTETHVSVEDWRAFTEWAMERKATEFFTRRIKKDAVEAYLETSGGELPPGVSLSRAHVVRVRKS